MTLSDPPRARAADIIRAAFPGATDDEIEIVIKNRKTNGARSVEAVLAHEIREGKLRLPCDRDAPEDHRHSGACRVGDSSGCGYGWCECRCHTEPAREAVP